MKNNQNFLVIFVLKKEIQVLHRILYIGDDMILMKTNYFVKLFLPNLAITYKKINGRIIISGFYRKINKKLD